ncbi:apolipoprotein N-acyltransferase [Consotaella aegiceratis]|uniref:apolipoprotein N-acyltransferase n=1 Tax=Consotaella aegiceratis TaxID=3097961 RepID=UPI002F3F516D
MNGWPSEQDRAVLPPASALRSPYGERSWFVRLADGVILAEGWRRALLAILAGALGTLALPPYNVPLFGFVAFTLLVWLLDGAVGDPGRGVLRRLSVPFQIGWMFGFGYFVAGLWWLGAAMMVDAALFAWAIPLAVLILPAILAIYFGLAAALAKLVWSDGAGRLFALAASFALFEYLRGILFTGFPWNEIGVMAAPVPLMMQSVSVVGLHGLTLVAILVFSAPALLADPRGRWRTATLGLAVVLTLAHLGFGAWRLATAETGFVDDVRLRVVQPGIEQSDKWDDAEVARIWTRLLDVTRQAGSQDAAAAASPQGATTLVVWPESALPFILTHRPDAIADLGDLLAPGELLVAGAARLEEDTDAQTRVYNSVYLIDDQGAIIDARDKVHLVPFGEYLPFQPVLESLGFRQLTMVAGGFTAGAAHGVVSIDGKRGFLPLVCYEAIFPSEFVKLVAQSDSIGFMVNVTNDAWYGHTPGPFQHLRQAELSAIAVGLPLVRSANTGISIVNDAYGQTLDAMALGSTGAIVSPLPRAIGATFYAQFPDLLFWCAFAVTCAVATATALTMSVRSD